MPQFKKVKITPKDKFNSPESDAITVQVSVSAKGDFYCPLPERITKVVTLPFKGYAFGSWCATNNRTGGEQLYNKTFESLVKDVELLYHSVTAPLVTHRLVLAYVVSYNSSFAVNTQGDIAKNAGGEGFKWGDHPKSMDGRTTFIMHSEKAHRVELAASAFWEVTTAYPNQKPKVEYKGLAFYGEEEAPEAALELNKWTRVNPLNHPNVQIIEYTDQKARAFDDLIFSMVTLAKNLSDFFGQDNALDLIESGGLALPFQPALASKEDE